MSTTAAQKFGVRVDADKVNGRANGSVRLLDANGRMLHSASGNLLGKTRREFCRECAIKLHPGTGADVEMERQQTQDEIDAIIMAELDAAEARAEAAAARDENAAVALPISVPQIKLGVDEHRVISETVTALMADPNLYRRGGMLVRVLRDQQPDDGILRTIGSPTIQQVPSANLRERMTQFAGFYNVGRDGKRLPAHPPPWLVSAVDARGEWSGIRALAGLSDTPILRADGSVWQQRGYDPLTGVLYDPGAATFPTIDPEVTLDDADAAAQRLLDVVGDFKFEAEDHQSAWLAAVLTPLGRYAYTGPSPLFLIDANVRGAGKGLLAQTIGYIALGREMPVFSYAHDSEEMRKKITSIAIAGDRVILLDNLAGPFGNDVLDRALTTMRWKDRILGKSEQVDLPLIAVWYATGNNVQVAADTTRRIIHIRLDVMDEKPEERTGFKRPNLLQWISENRPSLLADALTILSAFCRAGRPKPADLIPFGSFEGWSDLIRAAVVWLGLPDPCLTRIALAASSDSTSDALAQLITAWELYDPHKLGIIVSDMLARIYPPDRRYAPTDETATTMRTALEALTGCSPGVAPNARQVASKLRNFRRRVIDGRYLDYDENAKTNKGARWKLLSSDCCDSHEHPSARGNSELYECQPTTLTTQNGLGPGAASESPESLSH